MWWLRGETQLLLFRSWWAFKFSLLLVPVFKALKRIRFILTMNDRRLGLYKRGKDLSGDIFIYSLSEHSESLSFVPPRGQRINSPLTPCCSALYTAANLWHLSFSTTEQCVLKYYFWKTWSINCFSRPKVNTWIPAGSPDSPWCVNSEREYVDEQICL